MENFKDEKTIAAVDNERLTLTNYRLQYWGKNQYKSIRLADLTYVQYDKHPRPDIIKTGLTVCLFITMACFYFYQMDGLRFGLMLSFLTMCVVMLLYYLLQDRDLLFGSSGGCIRMRIYYMTSHECDSFMNLLETAIHEIKVRPIVRL